MQNVERDIKTIAYSSTSVTFADVNRILEALVTGLNGRPLKLAPKEQTYTDTETIFVPAQISKFATREQNFRLYKTIVTHHWAQNWFGTWHRSLEEITNKYKHPERAVHIFHALETIRLEACIKRELPGMAREMEQIRLLERAQFHTPFWRRSIDRLQRPDASVDDSYQLFASAYEHVMKIPRVSFQGILSPRQMEDCKAHRLRSGKKHLGDSSQRLNKSRAISVRLKTTPLRLSPPISQLTYRKIHD